MRLRSRAYAAHLRKVLPDAIRTHLTSQAFPGVETTPGVTSDVRVTQAATELIEAVDGFFARTAIALSLTDAGPRAGAARAGTRSLSTATAR